MANKNLFGTLPGRLVPPALQRNEAGGRAYARTAQDALAQYAATGCLNATFYATADTQLDSVLPLARTAPVEFVAKTAVYARERGLMKDMPALLVAVLAARDVRLFDRIFDRVVDTPRMLRTFVQITRSGVTGRKSFGTAPRRAVRRWLETRNGDQLFAASVGSDPSLADIVKMVHPKPATPARAALYGYLVGRTPGTDALPPLVREFEAFKAGDRELVPDVPFQMLTALDLGPREWRQVAAHASWQATRMNLNTFARHGVFEDADVTALVANRLADRAAIERARAYPYQLLAAHAAAGPVVPRQVVRALEDAMEIATANVPAFEGRVFVCPDVSGSMRSPVTGRRKGATTAVRCVDVAALMAAAILRRNPDTEVLPFSVDVERVLVSPRDTVMTTAERLAAVGGGGTCVSAPLVQLNERRAQGDLVIVVSDNESWADAASGRGTATMDAWSVFRRRNPRARLVLLDIQPSPTTQAVDRDDVLNVGGFSDQVFGVVAEFAAGRLASGHWAGVIDAVQV